MDWKNSTNREYDFSDAIDVASSNSHSRFPRNIIILIKSPFDGSSLYRTFIIISILHLSILHRLQWSTLQSHFKRSQSSSSIPPSSLSLSLSLIIDRAARMGVQAFVYCELIKRGLRTDLRPSRAYIFSFIFDLINVSLLGTFTES